MNLIELQDTVATCEQCELCKNRKVPVFAKGNPDARLMLVGMCPGPEENKEANEEGWPFIGRSGKLLDQAMVDSDLTLKDVYITNLIKCFLSPGLKLKEEQIEKCFPYLIEQIVNIKPIVVLVLGTDAGRALLNNSKSTSLASMRGKRYKFTDKMSVIVTYHPSYLVRFGGVLHKNYKDFVADLSWCKEIINRKKEILK